jgi:hypothetical protein
MWSIFTDNLGNSAAPPNPDKSEPKGQKAKSVSRKDAKVAKKGKSFVF